MGLLRKRSLNAAARHWAGESFQAAPPSLGVGGKEACFCSLRPQGRAESGGPTGADRRAKEVGVGVWFSRRPTSGVPVCLACLVLSISLPRAFCLGEKKKKKKESGKICADPPPEVWERSSRKNCS